MITIVIPGPTPELVQQQIQQANAKGDLLEFRLDLWEGADVSQALKLCKLPVLLTLRTESQGGKSAATLQQYKVLVQKLADFNPDYLDIEYDKDIEVKISEKTKLIRSYHNFKETPPNLPKLLQQMRLKPADLYKIAVTANSTPDALRIMRDLQGRDVIAIGMGFYGQITRITQPIFNHGLTFAVLSSSEGTAPGQLTADDLIDIYHYKTLNPATRIYALIGDPLEKSLSHHIHNQAFVRNQINAIYLKIWIKAEELAECMEDFKALKVQGLSVTMPLKEKIMPLLNTISKEAQAIGAINTVVAQNGCWHGINADAAGGVDAIEALEPIKGKNIVMIGIGGASKAVSHEAERRGAKVRKISRSLNNLGDVGTDYDILINATPSPMPIDPKDILSNKIVMDMVTRPKFTPFLQEAQAKSCRLVYGYQMWVNQACRQWEAWFPEKKDGIQKEFFQTAYEKLLQS